MQRSSLSSEKVESLDPSLFSEFRSPTEKCCLSGFDEAGFQSFCNYDRMKVPSMD